MKKKLLKIQNQTNNNKGKMFDGVKYSSRELAALTINIPKLPLDFVEDIRIPTKDNIDGRIDLSLTPYLRQPIACLADYTIEMIACIGPTQSGKTVVPQVCVAWAGDQDPGPLLYVGPDEDTIKKIMEEKIIGMIGETECLKKRIKKIRDVSKDGIELDSMTIYPAWSNSIASMNAFPKRRVIWDEARLFKLTVGKESNAIKLGQDRMTTYLNMGMAQGLLVSTPSEEGDILHQLITKPGTIELWWHVPCLTCGQYQLLDFYENVKLFDGEDVPFCRCKLCGEPFSNFDFKKQWNNKGVYAPKGWDIDENGKTKEVIPHAKNVVFRWDSMVSPFRSFNRIWDEYLETKDRPHDYKNFVQAWMARFWKVGYTKNSTNTMKLKKGNYPIGIVPRGVKTLVAGIDTQDNGLYYVVYGFGYDCECWLIDEGFIDCEIDITNAVDLQELVLINVVNKVYLSEVDGQPWKITIGAWDSGGHRTKEVYEVTRRVRQLIAIKGRNAQNRSVIFSKGDTHYNIRTDEYLKETETMAQGIRFHIPENVSGEFMQQFVNQALLKEQNPRNGSTIWRWISKGADHLRLASAYAFCCLDIPMDKIGTIRSRLRDVNFILNPRQNQASIRNTSIQQPQTRTRDPFEQHERIKNAKGRMSNDWWGSR